MRISLVILSLVAFIGCNNSKQVTSGREYETRAKWELESFNDKKAFATDFTSGLPWMSIMVDAMAFNGNGGCNTMSGTVVVTSEKITFSRIVTTRMACDKGDEAGFLAALQSANAYDVENDRLTLKNGYKVVAVFKKIGDVRGPGQ